MSDYVFHNGELYHYGIKGMKWGVRRYQNKDGSLTQLGKKRVDEGVHAFPTYKGKYLRYKSELSKNRDTVYENSVNDYLSDTQRKYEAYKKEHPSFAKDAPSESDRLSWWNARVRDKTEAEKTRQKYAKRFIEEYADATLSDLGIVMNDSTRKYTRELVKGRISEFGFGR